MTISLPENPSLENLRKQAKTLKRAWQRGDESALRRVRAVPVVLAKTSGAPRLADCQLIVARELGFASWPQLKVAVQSANRQLPEQFVTLACLCYDDPHYDHRTFHARAREILQENRWLAGADIWSAAAAGNIPAVRRFLDETPALANQPGPHGWAPLICACYSRVLPLDPTHSTFEAAKILLDRGADPNASTMKGNADERLDQTARRFTALTGLFGGGSTGTANQPPHPRWRELAELLLERGADPADEVAIRQNPSASLPILLRHGLKSSANSTLLGRALCAAARRGDISLVELLLKNAAPVDEVLDGKNPWQHAKSRGHVEIARIVEEAGARAPALTEEEQFISCCLAGDETGAREVLARAPDLMERVPKDMVHQAVGTRRRDALRLTLDLGFDPNAIDDNAAIHMAGDLAQDEALLKLLLERGGSLTLRDPWYDSTGIGWADFFDYHDLRDRLLNESGICLFDALHFDRLDRIPDILARDPAALERPFAECLTRAPTPDDWETPIERMRKQGKTEAVRVLLQHGARVKS
jgi:ankyrin repeat protein